MKDRVFRLFFCCTVDSKRTNDNVLQSSTVPADYNSGNHYHARCSPRTTAKEWKRCPCQTRWVFLQVYLWLSYVVWILLSLTAIWTIQWRSIKWSQRCDSWVKRMFACTFSGVCLGPNADCVNKNNPCPLGMVECPGFSCNRPEDRCCCT